MTLLHATLIALVGTVTSISGDLHLTLVSNDSTGNTLVGYSTPLPSSLKLEHGAWDIALVEVRYPLTLFTSSDNENIHVHSFVVTEDGRETLRTTHSLKVEPGYYKNVQQLIKAINVLLLRDATFTYHEDDQSVTVSVREHVTRLELSTSLALKLGFYPVTEITKTNNKGGRPADIFAGTPLRVYIYCNLVEPQPLGDTTAPLLQTVDIDTVGYAYGEARGQRIRHPQYVPVLRRSFHSVRIDLKDSAGQHMPFNSGTSSVKLHLRRRAT